MDWLAWTEVALRGAVTPAPLVDTARCLATRSAATACDACVAVCPRGAIARDSRPRIDQEVCDDCGACAAACPSGALESDAHLAAHRRWLEAIAVAAAPATTTGVISERSGLASRSAVGAVLPTGIVRCERAARTTRDGVELVVPCLGAVRPADLVTAAIAGADRLLMVRADCGVCDRGRAVGRGAEVLRVTELALEALGLPARTAEVQETDLVLEPRTPAATISRRDLLRMPRRRSYRATVEIARATESRSAALARRGPVPAWKARLGTALRSVPAGPSTRTLPTGLGIAVVSGTDACEGCGLCVLTCPMGAIECTGRTIVSNSLSCTACGLCREVCPSAAVVVEPASVAIACGSDPASVASAVTAPGAACSAVESAPSLTAADRLANRATNADRQMRAEASTRVIRFAANPRR